jgi:glycerophosphoryl diester phosphodiesterase
MNILSHRGYWTTTEGKNSLQAFERSFSLGFGTETDVRDYCGELVVAHDPPSGRPLSADVVFEILGRHNPDLPLAINIKADGLQYLLQAALASHGITNYFLFDMSIPDAIQSIKSGLRVFARQSDVEPSPVLYAESVGVWMDAFSDDSWITPDVVQGHLDAGKQVCIVSPELHKRPHLPLWTSLRAAGFAGCGGLFLCSDTPEEAAKFFDL